MVEGMKNIIGLERRNYALREEERKKIKLVKIILRGCSEKITSCEIHVESMNVLNLS